MYVWIKRLKTGGMDHVPVDLPDKLAPALVRHMERVAGEPGIVAYYAGRGKQA